VAFFFPNAAMGKPVAVLFYPPSPRPSPKMGEGKWRKMSIDTPLFDGSLVRFGPIDHEKDPEVVARWTHDAGFMRMM
jgi:hypothetical protein